MRASGALVRGASQAASAVPTSTDATIAAIGSAPGRSHPSTAIVRMFEAVKKVSIVARVAATPQPAFAA